MDLIPFVYPNLKPPLLWLIDYKVDERTGRANYWSTDRVLEPTEEQYSAAELLVDQDRILRIKAEARKRIVALANEDKQRNMTARVVELISQFGVDRSFWPKELIAEVEGYEEIWEKIKVIREYSNQLEADSSINPKWPE